jgi:N-acyl-L-homoserine lactone synthetase
VVENPFAIGNALEFDRESGSLGRVTYRVRGYYPLLSPRSTPAVLKAKFRQLATLAELKDSERLSCPRFVSSATSARSRDSTTDNAPSSMLKAVRNADSSKKKGIQVLVVQNPKKMGHQAVKALVTKMKGETVPTVITKENLDTPEIQALLACFFAVFA